MNIRLTGIVLLVSALAASPAFALHAVKPLDGYACMMLNLNQQQYQDPNLRVSVRAAPAAWAASVGWAAGTVAVREPLHQLGGFTEMLFPNGRTVWIESVMLRPYHSLGDPTAKCVPSIMSNGRLGFAYPH